ncbi:MAG TPA: FtsX-like permease family protein, partial [Clostridia bacterium]|nr:FtsX-like permease family protein [Clostridia bacterium]
ETLASQMEEAYPEANKDYTFDVGKISRFSVNTYPQEDSVPTSMSVLFLGMSGAVLLIACLNLANMMLARGTARRREIAIRLSLGSGRWRLVRQLLTEGCLLSFIGGLAGLLVSAWASKLLVASLMPRLPFFTVVFDPRPDWRILLVTFCFCLFSVLVFALGPAWRLTRTNVITELKEQVGDDSHGKVRRSLFAPRNLLVIAQLALSLALLTTAGLFARGAVKAVQANPGFSLEKLLLVETDAALSGYDETRAKQIYLGLLEKLRNLPSVQAASFSYMVPFGLFSDSREVHKAGASADNKQNNEGGQGGQSSYATFNIVATDYFKTLGMPLLRGRDFNSLEMAAGTSSGARVAIIDEPLAQRLWAGEDPVGRQIKFSGQEEAVHIVGVVPGIRDRLENQATEPHIYVPYGQEQRSSVNFHVRIVADGREAEAAMLKMVQDTIRSAHPHLAILSVQTLRQSHEEGLMVWIIKTAARLFAIFGAMALFLAVVGVYGVKAYVVARRTREIGIRIALGATSRDVLWMVLREGITLTAAGLAIGLGLSIAVGFAVRSVLYGVEAIDPLAFTLAPLSLAGAALIACYLPARRATAIQPMAALRCE